jgi:molybdenum cofactor guanylyltransferase
MGIAKAALPWDGTTLLDHVVRVIAAAVAGPIVVVRSRDQVLPGLTHPVQVVEDAAEGRGPLQGFATGLRAVGTAADRVFVAATDLPLLRPSVVRCVVAGLVDPHDAVIPMIGGFPHPLTAAYRTDVADRADAMLADGTRSLRALLDALDVVRMDEVALRHDPAVAADDPHLRSFTDVDTPQDLAALADG